MQDKDLRDDIFDGISDQKVTACIVADEEGLVVETSAMDREAKALGLHVKNILPEGSRVNPGDEIALMVGRPKQIAMAEERLIGIMAKPSGIATAALRFVEMAGPRLQIVAGAWKKMDPSQKEVIRRAITSSGASCRISNSPFLYLDKNYVRMFGGIRPCLTAVSGLKGYVRVLQLRGEYDRIDLEADEAAMNGADIIFIDTGRPDDISCVANKLKQLGMRDKVKIAFGGGIRLEDVAILKILDVDILDVGRPIIDAPLLDMRMEVIAAHRSGKDKSGCGEL
jgi:nicotinate-nucleotide pyrophosphorylase (carboxylating)